MMIKQERKKKPQKKEMNMEIINIIIFKWLFCFFFKPSKTKKKFCLINCVSFKQYILKFPKNLILFSMFYGVFKQTNK